MIELALPWGMSYMMHQNAYHPLYSYLMNNVHDNVTLNSIDDINVRRQLECDERLRNKLINKGVESLKFLPEYYASYFNDETKLLELGISTQIPSDVEFSHTSPIVSNSRPFILHMESFFSSYIPFEYDPNKIIQKDFDLKKGMQSLLESENCIGIYSHLSQTLDEISAYYDSPQIDGKLRYIPIGYDDGLPKKTKTINSRKYPVFLAVCSAHQNINNFVDRGGGIILEAWAELKKLFPDSILIWRSQRPHAEIVQQSLSSRTKLSDVNKLLDSIHWIERRVTDKELDNLFGVADFLLIPSLWVHSTSILRAMANGCIPIISDSPQLDEYRRNGGVIAIEGIRDLNWHKEHSIHIPRGVLKYSDHIIRNVVHSIESAWSNLELLRANTKASFECYDGKIRAHEFYETVLSDFNSNGLKASSLTRYSEPIFSPSMRNNIKNISSVAGAQPILIHASDPILVRSDICHTKPSEDYFYNDKRLPKPKLFVRVLDRIHEYSNVCWGSIGANLSTFSPYYEIWNDNVKVYHHDEIIQVLESKNDVDLGLRDKKLLINRYRKYLLIKKKIINKEDVRPDFIDVELIKDCGYFNIIRVYHMFVCRLKSAGHFDARECIIHPNRYGSIYIRRKLAELGFRNTNELHIS